MLKKLAAAIGFAPKKRSSPEISSIAGRIMRMQPVVGDVRFNMLLGDAKSLAGSVLSQDEIAA